MEAGVNHGMGHGSIGICGGTFDPIHYGHLIMAEEVFAKFALEKMLFVPSGLPPHKKLPEVTDARHRFAMVEAAVAGNPHFEASSMEIDREGYTYTIDTLIEIRKIYGSGTRIIFIIGADIIPELVKWKRFEEVFRNCEFAAVVRPEYSENDFREGIAQLRLRYAAEISIIEVPCIGISSTMIRQRVAEGKSIRYLVPEAVEQYIYKNGLYGKNNYAESITCAADVAAGADITGDTAGRTVYGLPDSVTDAAYDKLLDSLKEKLFLELSEKRYRHSIAVMECAVALAETHDCSPGKAAVAGLLHDCARDLSLDETEKVCSEAGIMMDEVSRAQPELLHGPAGSVIAKKVYGITDREILDAIYCHTTGKTGMSIFEKVIFLADYISPDRKFEGADKVRKLAGKAGSLDEALEQALSGTIAYVLGKGLMVHTNTVHARNFLIGREIQ